MSRRKSIRRSNASGLFRVAIIALLGAGLADAQQAISINFMGGGFYSGTPAPLTPSDVAGLVAVGNWNNVSGAGGTAGSLTDSSGASTPAAQVLFARRS
jgi:hypothetical protein